MYARFNNKASNVEAQVYIGASIQPPRSSVPSLSPRPVPRGERGPSSLIERSMEHSTERSMEHSMEHSMQHSTEPSIAPARRIERGAASASVEHSIEHSTEQWMEHPMGSVPRGGSVAWGQADAIGGTQQATNLRWLEPRLQREWTEQNDMFVIC